MEVYFLDVGQGSCNVILTGNRRAIVIDTGRRWSDLEKLLQTFGVNRISRLIISHLDADHCEGASGLITSFQNRIDSVYYPNDYRTKETRFWRTLRTEIKAGNLNRKRIYRLERNRKPRQIWSNVALQAELKLLSPTFSQNQDALDKNDANATCGVLVLHVGNRTVVFPGDSSLEQWKQIYEERGTR
ncbi:MAG: MBL fold metallo-hydrolase [Planctomycetales bacterium]